MDPTLSALIELAPQIGIAIVIIGAVAWFRKQDRADFASMQARSNEMVRAAREEAAKSRRLAERWAPSPDDTGSHVVSDPVIARLTEQMTAWDKAISDVHRRIDEQDREIRRIQETLQGIAVQLAELNVTMQWMRKTYSSPPRGFPAVRKESDKP